MAKKLQHTSIHLDADNYDWFVRTFPERGALPRFMDECLKEYRRLWGTRESPYQTTIRAVQNLLDR